MNQTLFYLPVMELCDAISWSSIDNVASTLLVNMAPSVFMVIPLRSYYPFDLHIELQSTWPRKTE